MPRATRSQGRPGTSVIPKDWETSHAPVVRKTCTADIIIWAATDGLPSVNADLSYPAASDTKVYEDTARIQVLDVGDTTRIFGEEYEAKAAYLVVIDRDADAAIDRGYVVEVAKSSDPSLLEAGRRLVVARVDRGSLRWERDLYCVDTVTTP